MLHTSHALRWISILATVLVIGAFAITPAFARADDSTLEAAQRKLQELMAILESLQQKGVSGNYNFIPVNTGANNTNGNSNGSANTTTVIPLEGGNTTATYSIGDRVVTVSNLNVRSEASVTGQLRGAQGVNSAGVIVNGPVVNGGYRWYQVDYLSGPDGWSVANWLTRVTTPESTADLKLYRNGTLVDTRTNLTRTKAAELCTEAYLEHTSDTVAISCLWNGDTIWPVAPFKNTNQESTADLKIYKNGALIVTIKALTEIKAKEACTEAYLEDKSVTTTINCIWNDTAWQVSS